MDSSTIKSNPSLVDALAQLEIRTNFATMPTEIFRNILCRVQTNNRFIRLRLVSNRWKAMIEDICRDKKSLVILDYGDVRNLYGYMNKFNGHLKLDRNFVLIHPKMFFDVIHFTPQGCTLLEKLFPHIELFVIEKEFSFSSAEFSSMFKQWSPSLTTLSVVSVHSQYVKDFWVQLNQLANLKHLNFVLSPFKNAKKLSPTLARLEHFSAYDLGIIDKILPFVGAGFSSLTVNFSGYYGGDMKKITEWSRIISNLERLNITTGNPKVFPLVCKHFPSLQMLHIRTYSIYKIKLTTMIQQLAQLIHLIELQIDGLSIDLYSYTPDDVNLLSLHNIRILSLENLYFSNGQNTIYCLPPNLDLHNVCQVLSTIFPNVEKLIVKNHPYRELSNLLFEPHRSLFVKLRSFDFSSSDQIRNDPIISWWTKNLKWPMTR